MRIPFKRCKLFSAVLVCWLCIPPAYADGGSSVEERMSYKEFTQYGLDKLSPEQLQGLNEWMRAHSSACPPAPTASSAAPAAVQPGAHSDRVVSRLVGDFRGWQQGTVLTLENGQHWEVRDDEPFNSARESAPQVTVEPGLLSGWRLSISGHNEIAHVIPAAHP